MAHRLPRKVHLPFSEEGLNSQKNLNELESLESSVKANTSTQPQQQQGGLFSEFLSEAEEKNKESFLFAPKPPVEDRLENALPKAKFYRRPGLVSTVQSIRPQDELAVHMGSDKAKKKVTKADAKKLEKQKEQELKEKEKKEQGSEDDLIEQFVLLSVEPSDLSKALEPKVMLPFHARPGETPRKIEIERRKRLYALQNIMDLLDHEGVTSQLIRPHKYNLVLIKHVDQELQEEAVSVDASDPKLLAKILNQETLTTSSPTNIFEAADQIPLYYFDDTEFESRTVDEWLNIRPLTRNQAMAGESSTKSTTSVVSGNGNTSPFIRFASIPVPCKVFLLEEWLECYMDAYNEQTMQFSVIFRPKEWKKIKTTLESVFGESDLGMKVAEADALRMWTDGIYLHFLANDPACFAKRVENACFRRNETTALLRFNLYVDSMPISNREHISKEQFERIIGLAASRPKLRAILSTSISEKLAAECRIDMARSNNKIEFLSELSKNRDAYLYLKLPDKIEEAVDWNKSNIIHLDYEFRSRKKLFSFTSFLTKSEVIKTLIKVRIECDKLATMNMFNTNINKTVRLDEFEHIQNQSLQTMKVTLKDNWLPTVRSILKTGLKDIGKGWYNVNETNLEVYNMSKLKRFMTTVQFIMQDSLRFLLLNSIQEYAKMIYSFMSLEVNIRGTNDVKVIEKDSLRDFNKQYYDSPKKPLFLMDLVCRDGKFHYNTDFTQFEQVIISTFEKSFGIIEGLSNLEPIVMDKLFWATKPSLESVHESDPFVVAIRTKLKQALEDTAIPLQHYIREYDCHLELLNLDVHQFMRDYEERDLPVSQIEQDINTQFEQREALTRNLPSVVNLGLYSVNCESIRNILRKDLSKALLEILAKKTAKESINISIVFHQMQQRLKERPTRIEDSKELREYIKTIPDTCRVQVEKIEKMLNDYEVLEKFRYELSNEDFKSKWNTFSWPARIDDIVKQVEEQLDIDEANFMRNLASDQEVFKERINQFSNMISDFAKYDDVDKIPEIVAEVQKISQELRECQNLVQLFNSRERLFNLPVTPYDEVAAITKEFEPYKSLWLTTNDWIKWKETWLTGAFNSLVPDDVEKSLVGAMRVMSKSVKTFKNTPSCLEVAQKMKEEMELFKPNLPLIQSLRNPGMRDRHWDSLSKELGTPLRPDDSVTLTGLLKMNLLAKIDIITKVCDVAGKEYNIEAALDKMFKEWEIIELDLIAYKESGTYIMRLSEDVVRLLDDHIVMTQSMNFSPYKKAFADRIALWDVKLRTVQEVLEAWTTCQRNWLYLEPIFSSDDISRQLPTESKRFGTMDRTWRRLMSQAKSKPLLLDFCADMRLLDSFRECNKLLEVVSKGLSAYLESKRLAFPRFFFLSDDEMLQILSQTKDPQAVQPHLRKCFENIAKLEFEKDNLITAMHASDGECVWMSEGFYPNGNVEDWLNKTEEMMKTSVRNVLRQGLMDYSEKPRKEWVICWPGQVILAVSQAIFTRDVSEAIHNGPDALKKYYLFLLQQLNDLVELVRGDLAPISRMILADLIIVDVHNRDIVKRLIDANITSTNDFDWISQIRYYWEGDGMVIKIVNASFNYGYEYLGNTGRLVITPLTDRCYLTLTGAMYLGMGGAPSGPAGTGKTETVKDLAKALAKQCVVFNCSDQLDYLAMAKFFKGLASAGAWACFDEFNRIDIEVLSVIAQQITTIQKAVNSGLTRFMFEGIELKLDPTNAIFITMNPGYAGRTELPDNLKALFRPVAMMIPDYAMIAEISLFSFGFSNAKLLAQKMVATFRLSSEQLSSQDHYDFGMRAVKTVISSAGNLKREQPQTSEELLLLRALYDCNLPKFLANDVPLFTGIISDLFPGVVQPKIDYGILLEAIKKSCEKNNLQPVESFLGKCIQLYETTIVRHGLMLVGPTGGGKTSCYHVLRNALTDLKGKCSPSGAKFERVQCNMLNPKSITMGQLYGEFDPQTHEWTDGILSCLVREGTAETSKDKKWYVFDGPVDAIWIESMNTVLDDNKKLCLSSGEIIKLLPTQTMIFEVENLAHASPATVSRCGMVYMEPNALGLLPLIKSWLTKQNDILGAPYQSKIMTLFDYFLEPGLEFVRRHIKETIPSTNANLTISLLKILQCLMIHIANINKDNGESEEQIEFGNVLEAFFFFSLIWSIGGTCDADGRRRFDTWLRGKLSNWQQQVPIPLMGLVFDYQFDPKKLEWSSWMQQDEAVHILNPTSADVIIPTIDTVRNTYLLDLLIHNHCHILCYGPTGTGKSATIQQKLLSGLKPDYSSVTLNFSARTSANQTADVLESKFEKRRKGVFGPPLGKRYVIFVDDLNMPALESTGAQPPIELLRQWMDYKGWYDRKNIGNFMEIVDIMFTCAMGPPGGGRNPVTQRLLRHFVYISFVEVEEDNLFRIFHTILKNFLSFQAKDLTTNAENIVRGSINVYNIIRRELLPTPAKSHYTFNLRDLSKIFQGILLSHMKSIESQNDLFQLWAHECLRVFSDRLIDSTDKNWFLTLLKTTMLTFFHRDWAEVVTTDPLLFGDYMTPGADPKQYVQVRDMRKLVKVQEEYLEDYNSATNNPMRLVMFLDAIEHVSRICRIIRQPSGHALLLGVGGSGRQSLSRLASFMEEYDCIQIEITKSYGQTEWREDLKKVLLAAGLEGKPISFLYSDTQIIAEGCIEDINNILNSGDVPNIYHPDELDRINTAMRTMILDSGGIPTKEAMFSLFLSRVRQNLHIIFCMSPIGEAFRNRLRMFPSLVNCCTIDWFSTWPEEALRSVAAYSISEISDLGMEDVMDGIVDLCVKMHETVREKSTEYKIQLNRYNYVTPTSYLELLGLYKKLLAKKREELTAMKKRTATGLEKLLNSTKEVEILQEELEAMQPMLIQTSQETEDTMKRIAVDKVKAEEIREIIVKEELEASKKAEETKAIAEEAKKDLDEALPALDAAVESLNSLSKNDIIEVRSMQRPPDGVKLVMEAVCIIKGIKPKKIESEKVGKKVDDYWEPAKALLAEPTKFLDSLLNYDKDNIPEPVIVRIKPYIDSPDFQVSAISRVSKAATSICQWVRATEKYYHVSKGVAPKRARLKEAQDSLEITLKTLSDLKRRMREAEINIKEMEKKYVENVAKKEELGRKVEECNLKLGRADKLISGLSGEKKRWAQIVEELEAKSVNIVGDILVAAGAIAYLGPFTHEFRQSLLHDWLFRLQEQNIPHSEATTLFETLGESVKVREWEIHGLPRDTLSRDNAIIADNSRRWPLFIDPQGQANKWIRNMEADNALDIIKLTEKDFLRTLENDIRFGKPCLLENVGEKLDPSLEPVLLRNTFKQGGNVVIKIGDSVLPYHDDFRFYITTKLSNPHYSPELSATVTLLNFTLSPIGLEDQLLSLIVANERPDLEEAKNAIVISNSQMKKELKDLEDKILYLLSSVQGSPVDDERLIETLAQSKETSAEISTRVQAAEKTERDIDATRNGYKSLAIRTRIMFFCITELANIDPMYQYSLNWFMNLFTSAIMYSEKADNLEDRLKNVNDYFTYSLYSNVCRSLFETHKLLFSFLLCTRILMDDNKIDMDEWKFLLTGAAGQEKKAANPAPAWFTQQAWSEVLMLSTLPNFLNFHSDFEIFLDYYKKIFDSPQPHREKLPGKWGTKLNQFQNILVLRCIRPDKVTSAIQDFVAANLGEKFIEPLAADFSAFYRESSPLSPLIFVLSPGADPASVLYKFAEEMRFSKKLLSISLGQGQGPKAEEMIREGSERGLWVLAQNCHLSPSWMPSLVKIIDSITPEKVHRDFRLWLSSMPTPKFPVSILQNGVKMTIEPPKGIKANLLRVYTGFSDEMLSKCTAPKEWKKLLLALSFFHAVVQERRKFGALGWNIPYEFTDGDLQICIKQLKMFLEEYNEVPYKVLKYTVGHINYGGRVTDDFDRRLIMNIIEDFYNPQVLEDMYPFSGSSVYYSIPADNYNTYKNYIKQLPINETTEIFGLHENANITYAQKETYTIMATLLALMPKTSTVGGAKGRDQQLIDTAEAIIQKVPSPFDAELVQQLYPIDYKESMSTVLTQEVIRYNRLLDVIHSTLRDMVKALKGLVVMSESLETMCQNIFMNQVPVVWAAKAYPSLKPLSGWVVDLFRRLEFLQTWIEKGIPKKFWISGFFFPQAFLTAALQNHARKYFISIDTLSFDFTIMRENFDISKEKHEDGVYVYGMYIEGARWDGDKQTLTESRPKELFTEMPIFWLHPQQHRAKPDSGYYDCPVYKTQARAGTLSTTGHSTNYVVTMEVPSAVPQSYWIKMGVAMILTI